MKAHLMRITLLTCVLFGVLASVACAGKSIRQVVRDPSRYHDREVRVNGYVVASFSIVGRGAYRIEDRTGELWVVSGQGVPHKGQRVSVTGVVREAFNLGSIGDRIGLPGIGQPLVLLESYHEVKY